VQAQQLAHLAEGEHPVMEIVPESSLYSDKLQVCVCAANVRVCYVHVHVCVRVCLCVEGCAEVQPVL
jgi:hypothetical protein